MADLFAPDLSIPEVLSEFGVDGMICRVYRDDKPRRIALLRIHHAAENTQSAVDWVADVLSEYLANPATYSGELCDNAKTLAAKLRILANELEKSLPVVSLREGEHAETTEGRGLRGEDRPAIGEGPGDPPDRTTPDDWGDVPF